MPRDDGYSGTERKPEGAVGRLILAVFAGLSAFFGPFFFVLWLLPSPEPTIRLALADLPPLQPIARASVVVAPAAIALPAIADAMERAAPRNLTGRRESDGKTLPISGTIDWTIARGPLTLAGRAEGLQISTALAGSLQANGTLAQLGGALGNRVSSFMGGNLGRQVQGLAGRPLDQKIDLRGNVVVTARPAILSNWRIAPNLDAQASVADVALPIGGVRLSVANEVTPLLDRSVREQVAALEARVRDDPMLETAARREWAKMCRAIPLGSASPGMPNLWLEVKPTRAAAAQPRIDATALHLILAVEAQTRIVPTETKPACPFPARLELAPTLNRGAIRIGVPIDLPFTEVNKLLEPQLKGRKFPEDGGGAVEVTIKRATLAASGERLLISLLVNAREKKSWFSFGADATVHVWGKPALDAARQVLRLEDVELDIDSDAAFGLLGAAADAAKPQLRAALAERAVIDLKPFAADARKRVDAAFAEFRKAEGGVKVNAAISDLRLIGIDYDAKTLRVIAEANGSVDVAVTRLALD